MSCTDFEEVLENFHSQLLTAYPTYSDYCEAAMDSVNSLSGIDQEYKDAYQDYLDRGADPVFKFYQPGYETAAAGFLIDTGFGFTEQKSLAYKKAYEKLIQKTLTELAENGGSLTQAVDATLTNGGAQIAAGTVAKLANGASIGTMMALAIQEIYNSPNPESESLKQGLMTIAATAAGVAAAGVVGAAGGATLAGVATVALAGTLAGLAMETIYDNIVNNVAAEKALLNDLTTTTANIIDGLIADAMEIYDATGTAADDIVDSLQDKLSDLIDDAICETGLIADKVGEMLAPVQAFFQQAEAAVSAVGVGDPIVFDLDGDGIELTDRVDSNVYFNLSNTEFKSITGWATGGDGMLVSDINNNGEIDDATEIIGGVNPQGGFAELKANYDTNQDGVLNSSDSTWGGLRVWIDADEDGYADSGELQTFSSLSITSLNLNVIDVDYQLMGNNITQEGTYTINGVDRLMVDAWFAFDTVNTIYADPYDLAADALFLPEQRGYGEIPNLSIAMSLDEDLLDMVTAVATATRAEAMDTAFDLKGKMRDIVMKWAGVENVTPTNLGSGLDAQEVAFLNKLLGQEYNNNTNGYNVLVNAWNLAFGTISANILAQVPSMASIFGNRIYDPVTDGLLNGEVTEVSVVHYASDASTFSGTAFNDVYLLQPGDGSKTIDEFAGGTDTIYLHGVDPADVGIWTGAAYPFILNMAIKYSDTEYLTLRSNEATSGAFDAGHFEKLIFDDGTVWTIGGENTGTILIADDNLRGLAGSDFDDIITDGAYGNWINGYAGNDILRSGAGNDTASGMLGDDTYIFYSGDGYDTVQEYEDEGTDKIVLHDVDAEDVKIWGYHGSGLGSGYISIKYGAGDQVTLGVGQEANGAIKLGIYETVEFDDETVWNLLSGLNMVHGDEALFSGISGTNYADTIVDGASGNYINGYDGNDTITGGGGGDNLSGMLGNDTYVFNPGDGYDVPYESEDEGTDKIVIHSVLPSAVKIWALYAAGKIFIQYGETDRIDISVGHETNGAIKLSPIETVEFDNSTVWNLNQGLNLVYGDAYLYNSALVGSNYSDSITDGTNSHTILAYDGNDTLTGGVGGDNLNGMLGNDTYVFNPGDGYDTVYETIGEGTDKIVIHEALPANVQMWTVSGYNGPGYIYIQYGETDRISVIAGLETNGAIGLGTIESVEFDNQTVWDLSAGLNIKHGDAYLWSTSIRGSNYADTIEDGTSGNQIYGYDGNDVLKGGDGGDTILAGDGDDFIWSGEGSDYITGDAGADIFVFEASNAFSASDWIGDFNTGDGDALDINSLLTGYDPLTDAITDFVLMEDSGSNTTVKIDSDGTDTTYSFAQIATLGGVTGLTDEAALVANGNLIVA